MKNQKQDHSWSASVIRNSGCIYRANTAKHTNVAPTHPATRSQAGEEGGEAEALGSGCAVFCAMFQAAAWRAMAVSFTGRFTSAASTPRAMAISHTTS